MAGLKKAGNVYVSVYDMRTEAMEGLILQFSKNLVHDPVSQGCTFTVTGTY